MNICDTIREERGERSLRDFAEVVGVSHTALNNWEKGRSTPSAGALIIMVCAGGRAGKLGRRLMRRLYPALTRRLVKEKAIWTGTQG